MLPQTNPMHPTIRPRRDAGRSGVISCRNTPKSPQPQRRGQSPLLLLDDLIHQIYGGNTALAANGSRWFRPAEHKPSASASAPAPSSSPSYKSRNEAAKTEPWPVPHVRPAMQERRRRIKARDNTCFKLLYEPRMDPLSCQRLRQLFDTHQPGERQSIEAFAGSSERMIFGSGHEKT